MKKIVIGSFGAAVVVLLLIISSATAINVVQSETKTTQKKDVYVEPNIRLTRSNLPLLKRSLNQIKDLDYKYVLQQIIKCIDGKGIADSNNIREILSNHSIEINDVYSFCTIYTPYSHGVVYCFPTGLIRSCLFSFFSKGGIIYWEASNNLAPDDYIYVKINDQEYTSEHEGVAIGYFGSVSNKMQTLQGNIWYTFYLGESWRSGFAILAFVK